MMFSATKRSDLVLAIFVIAITAMLLVPLPTMLLDLLLALNISFALLLLLAGLYMPNALALLSFPSLLLLTTLFRLSLNVASTRLILSDANAGKVIEAFGSYLIRDEVVVGVIIFVIITIVNFIVIARGSGRVSEVAARFALDALPGKQMSIDADLRAGTISTQEARRRRDDLRKESQLYGSMDGAMRFVQGDAIAGFFIIFTNIVGGLYLGVSNGMSFGEAMNVYTRLTVGDGLVSQIPAILISICAGIVVTRVSSGENTTLGADVGAQLFKRPGTILFSGLLLFFIASLPGLPPMPFILVGSLFVASALYIARTSGRSQENLPALTELGSSTRALLGSGMSEDRVPEESTLEVRVDAAVLYKLYAMNVQNYRLWWKGFQLDFYEETGVELPGLTVVPDEKAPTSHFSIYNKGSLIDSGSVLLDSVLVEVSPDSAECLGIEVSLPTEHPISGAKVFWALQSPALRRIAEAGGIPTFDFMEYICLKVAVFFRSHPEEVLTLTDVHKALKDLESKYPGLVADALSSDFVNVARMTEIIQELVREGINVRDFKQIVESVATYCATDGRSLIQDDEFDLQDIVSFIRMNKRRQIVSGLLSPRHTLKVVTLSDGVEELMEGVSMHTTTEALAIEPSRYHELSAGLETLLGPLRNRGILPVSILCKGDIRHQVSVFIRRETLGVGVVTVEELDRSVQIETVGTWAM